MVRHKNCTEIELKDSHLDSLRKAWRAIAEYKESLCAWSKRSTN